MRHYYPFILCSVAILLSTVPDVEAQPNWNRVAEPRYTLCTSSGNNEDAQAAQSLLLQGVDAVNLFFHSSYKDTFTVYIHPNRHSLDSTWQKDWGVSDFKSECWMVASGIATKLDVLSLHQWKTEACEHDATDTLHTQQLITHELVHVYHGQLNASPDFSATEGIDWFVEGLATYAAGQCDGARIAPVKQAVVANTAPTQLNDFWKGQMKYGMSGTMVMYIDHQFGRKKLISMLPLSKKVQILAILGLEEETLIQGWKAFVLTL